MSRQLDILALEPYFGGARRNMLETLVRCSRHRWTLLTLPPRRMERRLAAAAHWFSEQIARRDVGHIDLVYTCDAINLADLYRLCPAVADRPSVVYFHCNQLPDPRGSDQPEPVDLTILTTATAATEIWFNSQYHGKAFLDSVAGLVRFHPELQSQNPVRDLQKKLRHMPPPVDMGFARQLASDSSLQRDPLAVYVDTHDANLDLLNAALEILYELQNDIHVVVSGPTAQLSTRFPRHVVADSDRIGQVRAIVSAGAFVSCKIAAPFDEHAVLALSIHGRVALPHTGVYRELVPKHLQSTCLYDMSAEGLASGIHEALFRPARYRVDESSLQLHQFDQITACAMIDDRLDQLASRDTSIPVTAAHTPMKTETRKPRRPVPNG